MKIRAAILFSVFVAIPFAKGGAAYVMAESFTPGYSALDMTIDLSVDDSFTGPNYNRLQQDNASFTGSWYFTRTRRGVHQIDITAGAEIGSLELRGSGGYASFVQYSVPVYFRYNYNFTLWRDTFFYAGPFAGGVASSHAVDIRTQTLRVKDTDAAVAGLCGVGVGLRHFGVKWGVELGYDFRLHGAPEAELVTSGGLSTRISYGIEHQLNLRMIFRF